MSPFQKFDHKLIFVILIRYINTKLLKSCSKTQKLLEVAEFGKSCSKRQKLLKSCRAQSVRAYLHLACDFWFGMPGVRMCKKYHLQKSGGGGRGQRPPAPPRPPPMLPLHLRLPLRLDSQFPSSSPSPSPCLLPSLLLRLPLLSPSSYILPRVRLGIQPLFADEPTFSPRKRGEGGGGRTRAHPRTAAGYRV